MKRFLAALLAAVMMGSAMTGCAGNTASSSSAAGTASASGQVDTSKEVNLVMYLWGGEGVANKSILAELNKKLKKDINATLEIKYIDWGDISTKYPLLFTAGEKYDMVYVSRTAPVSYYTLAEQGSLYDISDLIDKAAPKLKTEISQENWESVKYKGKTYAVPCAYSEFTPYGYAYDKKLAAKYGVSDINSLSTMEAYMDKVVKNEKFAPINGNTGDGQSLYRMFVDMTNKWVPAPGIPDSQPFFVASSPDKYTDIIHPAFTQEFEDWAVRMHDWSQKGYLSKDILSSQVGSKDNFNNGLSGGFTAHMPDWTGNYGALQKSRPGTETNFWSPAESTGKIEKKLGVDNATGISSTSQNPERALMALQLFMTDESYYRLLQYGIEGKQYEIANNMVQQPKSFNKDKDAGGFATWSLRNDKFNLPLATEDPRRVTLINDWKKTAISDPFANFSFNPANVSAQLSSIANVNSTLGVQILLGKTDDPKKAVEQYRQQLKQAGIDDVITELKNQLKDYKPVK